MDLPVDFVHIWRLASSTPKGPGADTAEKGTRKKKKLAPPAQLEGMHPSRPNNLALHRTLQCLGGLLSSLSSTNTSGESSWMYEPQWPG